MKYNIIIKPERFEKFTIVPSHILRHRGMSVGATGLYAWLFSHDSKQQITVEFICNHFKENKTAIASKIKELIESGYLIREKVLDKGKFKGFNYILNDIPKSEKPMSEKPKSENPAPENQPQSNNNNNIYNSNINKSNNNVLKHFIDLFPKKFHPKTNAQIKKWELTLDQLERIDGYDLREVYKIVKHIRGDHFWKKQFLSLPKLRNVDKNGDKWIFRYEAVYSEDNKPIGFNKIKNLKKFKIYRDLNNEKGLGAELLDGTELNQFNLSQLLDKNEIKEIIKYLENE